MSKLTGHCKWFNATKGFGFIVPDDGSEDIFVHQSGIQSEGFRSLAENEKVEYFLETDETGKKKAVSVTGPAGSNVMGQQKRRSFGGRGRGRGGGRGFGRNYGGYSNGYNGVPNNGYGQGQGYGMGGDQSYGQPVGYAQQQQSFSSYQ